MWWFYGTSILIIGVASDGQLRRFPDKFKFGAATSAYQIEGGWNAGDKSDSIWDYALHSDRTLVKDHSNADVAADSYHFYKRDVEMLTELGVDFYRFSLSWSRILPNGFSNKVSKNGLRYYNNLIDELIANGIEPVVTLYHWDLPQILQELGGWTSNFVTDYFEDYARVVFENFGDRVKTWITFNEPTFICQGGYGGAEYMPQVNISGVGDYLCSKTVLLAHAKAYHLYHAEFYNKYKGRVGITDTTIWGEPATDSPDDIKAAETYLNFQMSWFTDPIYTGDYPKKMKEIVSLRSKEQGYARSRLPKFTHEEKEFIKGTSDFFGTNHYTTQLISAANASTKNVVPSMFDDMNVQFLTNHSWSFSSSADWLAVKPDGFRTTLNWIKNRYNNPEILVLENGYSTVFNKNSLIDDDRIKYYRLYLDALLDAIYEDGVNVTHYAAWSLMDEFEWLRGFTSRFGLYEVDYDSPNRTRTARKSAFVYKEIIRARVVDHTFEPISMNIIKSQK